MAQAVRTFRIFVSSTFNDLKEERNALQRHVFTRLRSLCQAHGTRFQAVDLRWGVRQEAGLDQRTMQICFDEIDRCRKASPRPNFVILLGDRYGWRPLPAVIPAVEFERLLPHVASGADRTLVDAWYRRDDNALPPEYCLQPRRVEEAESARRAEEAEWAGIEPALRRILTTAATRADLSADERVKYDASATEQEIRRGALRVDDALEHVFCYFREIVNPDDLARDLPTAPKDEEDHPRDFVDVGNDGAPDAEARQAMRRLKQTLAETLPGNVRRYQTRWLGRQTPDLVEAESRTKAVTAADVRMEKVIDALARAIEELRSATGPRPIDASAWTRLQQVKEDELRKPEVGATTATDRPRLPVVTIEHLPALCADVFMDLARIILAELARLEERDPLAREIRDHEDFGSDRSAGFIGRAAVLGAIERYATGGDARPLVLHGESGTGKSSVMARAVERVAALAPRAAIVQRFIGATPGSSDIRTLLDGLSRQISRLYDADETTIPTEYRELITELPKRLALATADRPLVVFLDALDQLSDADHARNLIWLPATLPEHARVIVSTLPGECLSVLQRKLPDSLVRLEPMPRDEAGELLKRWLDGTNRTLTVNQRSHVLDRFSRTGTEGGDSAAPRGLPLYLKLAFEEARRWKSYAEYPLLSADVPGVIRNLFARLSSHANHGPMLVARSLAYIAAGKNGLSEDELIDVLTIDDEVYGDFETRARHRPPERRLPVVIWSRLYFDLERYLTERAADGASLLAFYHRQLREVVEQDFLPDGPAGADDAPSARTVRHRVLARYFKARALFEGGAQAPNVRKLSELPYQQTHGALWDDLYATLTDFDFLEAKCTHVAVVTQGTGDAKRTIYGGVYDLQEDYRRALEKFPA